MEALLSLMVGLGLSAACGFRVFVPLLVMSVAAYSGHLSLAPSFEWIASPTALVAFSVATVLEIGGYYIPWVDNFLDSVMSPAAVVAGTIATASTVSDMSPFMTWSTAIIAGGGVAALVQSITVFTRGASSVGTAGLANPVFATAELGGSLLASVMSVFAPIAALVFIGVVVFFGGRKVMRLRASKVALEPVSAKASQASN